MQTKNRAKRSLYLDVIKGLAIFLVVLGHCIQYGSCVSFDKQFYEDPIFKFIYSFHMPLFMLISGFLFYNSVNRHSWEKSFKSRFTKLIIPIVIWNTLYIIVIDTYRLFNGIPLHIGQIASYLTALWFLWAIFWSSITVLIIRRLFKDRILIYVLLGILALFLPSKWGSPLYIYMYPYFIMGYLWNKYHLESKFHLSNLKIKVCISFLCVVLFCILYMNFTKEDYIYTTGINILKINPEKGLLLDFHQISIDLYRYLIGFVGAATILIIINILLIVFKIKEDSYIAIFLSKIGQKTLGIYIISGYLQQITLPYLPYREQFGLGVVIIEAICLTLVSYHLTILLEKNKFGRMSLGA